MKTLKDIGEREAIRRLARRLFPSVEEIIGIGDDCAVVRAEGSDFDWVLTSDPVIEGTHFTVDTDKRRVGHKAVGRVLSDLAAMGAEPSWLLINIVAPDHMPFDVLEKVYEGVAELTLKYGVAVVGGDMAQGPVLELHVFGMGQVPHGTAIGRGGASGGDLIYVTGSLGGSLAGKHLDFEPRIAEGLWLREQRWPTSMIDLSDGLATDLRHLLQASHTGAEIDVDRIPVSEAAQSMEDGVSPVDHALYDGEDFELLFTIPKGKRKFFESAWQDTFETPCACIGEIVDNFDSIGLRSGKSRRDIVSKGGYEHFSGSGE